MEEDWRGCGPLVLFLFSDEQIMPSFPLADGAICLTTLFQGKFPAARSIIMSIDFVQRGEGASGISRHDVKTKQHA